MAVRISSARTKAEAGGAGDRNGPCATQFAIVKGGKRGARHRSKAQHKLLKTHQFLGLAE
jgi:hypothetical protein